jgi:hypothetical protein
MQEIENIRNWKYDLNPYDALKLSKE